MSFREPSPVWAFCSDDLHFPATLFLTNRLSANQNCKILARHASPSHKQSTLGKFRCAKATEYHVHEAYSNLSWPENLLLLYNCTGFCSYDLQFPATLLYFVINLQDFLVSNSESWFARLIIRDPRGLCARSFVWGHSKICWGVPKGFRIVK